MPSSFANAPPTRPRSAAGSGRLGEPTEKAAGDACDVPLLLKSSERLCCSELCVFTTPIGLESSVLRCEEKNRHHITGINQHRVNLNVLAYQVTLVSDVHRFVVFVSRFGGAHAAQRSPSSSLVRHRRTFSSTKSINTQEFILIDTNLLQPCVVFESGSNLLAPVRC